MAVDVGPDRERRELEPWQADMFTAITEYNTRTPERWQLSQALKGVRQPQGLEVIDGFHRNARKIWRTNIGP